MTDTTTVNVRPCPFCGATHESDKAEDAIRDTMNALMIALQAIVARINGEWDHPALAAFGPLLTINDDVLAIARAAIAKAEGR